MDNYLMVYVYKNGTAEYRFCDTVKRAIADAVAFIHDEDISHTFVINLRTQKEEWDSAESECSHPEVKVKWSRVFAETRDQPAEYKGWAECTFCHEEMDVDDAHSNAHIID